MRSRPLARFVLLALLLVPSTAFAQGAGDDQYTDPVGSTPPPAQAPSNPGSSGANPGSSGSGSGSSSATPTAQSPSTSPTADTSSSNVNSADSGSRALPATGLPVAILFVFGLLFTLSGRRLRRASREPAPDPYAGRSPNVPASSPVARAARRRSRSS